MEFKVNQVIAASILGVAIGLGLAVCGGYISSGIVQFRAADRMVTVKGLAEKEVKSDLAVWNIVFKTVGNDLESSYGGIQSAQDKIIAFLSSKGFSAEEISVAGMQVTDMLAREYGNSDAKPDYRYILRNQVIVRTTQVDKIASTLQASNELVKNGVLLEDLNTVKYFYTQLNAIRPEMLALAAESARKLAEQFAQDSGSHVGQIRRANQGVFKILPRDGAEGDFGAEDTTSIYKKVRVVSTIDYSLE
jgi:uncharacterized protein